MKKIIPLLIALGIGLLISLQFRSFTIVEETFRRDRNPNIFREVHILKNVTDELRKEKEELITKKTEFSTKFSTLQAFEKEGEIYQLLSGEISVMGSGIRLLLPETVAVTWFTDIVNELVTAGAEAIAVNDERIGPNQAGFRVVSDQTLLLGDRVLRPPFRIEAIGDKKILHDALLQPGSVLSRLEQILKNKPLTFTEEERLVFKAIP